MKQINTDELYFDIKFHTHRRKSLAFALSSLQGSQVALNLLNSLYEIEKTNTIIDYSIYNLSGDVALMPVNCAIYSKNDILSHKDNIFVLDPFACHSFLSNKFSTIYYYVYDPLMLKVVHPIIRDAIIQNKDVKFIARNKQHRNLLTKEFSIICEPIMIEELNVQCLHKFLELS